MNIQIYDWNISNIGGLLGDSLDERRIVFNCYEDRASVSVWLTPEQADQIREALDKIHPVEKEVTL
jgi:hypothetical protein